jgi:hypothetical protein
VNRFSTDTRHLLTFEPVIFFFEPIGAMPATAFTAVTSFQMICLRKYHQAIFDIIIRIRFISLGIFHANTSPIKVTAIAAFCSLILIKIAIHRC